MLGEFTITGVIGEGGFGTVYLAHEATLDRTVAIKEYLPVTIAARVGEHSVAVRYEGNRDAYAVGLQSFMREARLQARFAHPAMLEVYRVWEQNGTAYMAMRYYPGESLRELRKDPALADTFDEASIKRILLPVFDAVRELHSQSVLHRDVSPDNILILPSGAPVLLDLGAARMIVAGAAQSLTTVLKPGYAPIEQYTNDGTLEQGPWTDVYGLAAVMYFLAIGNPPPQAVTRMLKDTLREFDERVAGRYSEAFVAAIKKALAVRPENRLQSVTALIEALGWDDSPLPEPLRTVNVTATYTVAAAISSVSAGPLIDPLVVSADDNRAITSVAAEPASAPVEQAAAVAAAPVPLNSPVAFTPSSSATLPQLQPTAIESSSAWRKRAWLWLALLLLGATFVVASKFWHDAQAPTNSSPGTELSKPPADEPQRPAQTRELPTNSSPSPVEPTRSRPASKGPQAKVATPPNQPGKSKSAETTDVSPTRRTCDRIFAKLSLGTAELTDVEQQQLVACK